MSNYGKYGLVDLNAVNKLNHSKETNPCIAWDEAPVVVFPMQLSSRKKGCPRSAFLGLCEEVGIKCFKSGGYISSKANKAYANDALALLQSSPNLTTKELWDKVISNAEPKAHNSQMNVVAALFHEGYLVT
jgi:hypothetical protein